MSDLEHEEEYEFEIYDLHQDRPTQDTPSGGSPIKQTRAKSYLRGTRNGKDRRRGKDPECSEDEQATLPPTKKPIFSLSLLMLHNDHSTVREDDLTLEDRQVPGYRRNQLDSDPDDPTAQTTGRSTQAVGRDTTTATTTRRAAVRHNGGSGGIIHFYTTNTHSIGNEEKETRPMTDMSHNSGANFQTRNKPYTDRNYKDIIRATDTGHIPAHIDRGIFGKNVSATRLQTPIYSTMMMPTF